MLSLESLVPLYFLFGVCCSFENVAPFSTDNQHPIHVKCKVWVVETLLQTLDSMLQKEIWRRCAGLWQRFDSFSLRSTKMTNMLVSKLDRSVNQYPMMDEFYWKFGISVCFHTWDSICIMLHIQVMWLIVCVLHHPLDVCLSDVIGYIDAKPQNYVLTNQCNLNRPSERNFYSCISFNSMYKVLYRSISV